MKKILGFVMILITVITVAGCGGKDMELNLKKKVLALEEVENNMKLYLLDKYGIEYEVENVTREADGEFEYFVADVSDGKEEFYVITNLYSDEFGDSRCVAYFNLWHSWFIGNSMYYVENQKMLFYLQQSEKINTQSFHFELKLIRFIWKKWGIKINSKERFIEMIVESGMNWIQFAAYFDIPYRTMQDWERGNRKMPDYLLRLMEYKLMVENLISESKENVE